MGVGEAMHLKLSQRDYFAVKIVGLSQGGSSPVNCLKIQQNLHKCDVWLSSKVGNEKGYGNTH